jgi:S1-C subfamily serine protease
VRAHFAYAGAYWSELEDDIAAQTLKKHDIYSFIAHCDDDQVVSSEGSRKLVEYFEEHEVAHGSLFIERGGHGFTSQITRAAQEFVAKWCRDEELPQLEGKVEVTDVVADSQAAEIGLKPGDVLTSYDGKPITKLDDLQAAIAAAEAAGKESVELIWKRGEEEMKAAVKPGRLGVHLADR